MPILFPLEKRLPYRKSLASLNGFREKAELCLVQSKELSKEDAKFLIDLTGCQEVEGQLAALEAGIKQIEDEYHAILLEYAPKDLTAFSEYVHSDEPPALHHFFICERIMENAAKHRGRLILSAPPGSAKTTYASRDFAAWFLGCNPREIFLQSSHTQSFCDDELGTPTRNLVNSEKFRDVFPGIYLDPAKKAAGSWRLNNDRGRYYCRGAGAGISGFRASQVCLDDPFASREMAESVSHSNKIWRWFTNDLSLRLLPTASMFLINTRWTTHDIAGRLLDSMKNGDENIDKYEYINLAGLALEDDPLGRAEGEPLWEDFWPKAHYLNQKATLMPREWNSLYQGSPTDEEGGVLQSDWLTRYTHPPTHEGRPPPPPDFEESHEQQAERLRKKDPDTIITRLTLSVDTAIKATDRSNYTAITIWAQVKSGKHYLIDVIRRRAEFNDMVQLIDAAARKHNVSAILVEDKGSGTQYIQTQQGKSFAPIISISVQNQTKEFRFDSVTPMFAGGLVLLPHSGLWLPDYEKELLEFPASKYDDQVDSTSQYLSWAKPAAKGGMKRLRGGV